MIAVRVLKPAPALAGVVERYMVARAALAGGAVRLPMAARPDQFLEFYLADRHGVVDRATGAVAPAPAVVLVGPSTFRRVDLEIAPHERWVSVHFRPGATQRLFGLPTWALTDAGVAAEDVLAGPRATRARAAVARLAARLPGCADEAALGACLDAELAPLVDHRGPPAAAPALVAAVVRRLAGGATVRDAAARVGRSARQVERVVRDAAGVTPRAYARLVRLQRALRWRERLPGATWAEVAQRAGYFDQMHLVREFRTLAAATPTAYAAAAAAARDAAGALPPASPAAEAVGGGGR